MIGAGTCVRALLTLGLFAQTLSLSVPTAAGESPDIVSRVEIMQRDFSQFQASAGKDADVTLVPGRAEFISWALSAVASEQQAGRIKKDDDFVAASRAAGKSVANRSESFIWPSTGALFRMLGHLKAAEAVPMLSQHILAVVIPAADGLGNAEDVFPAVAALAEIGEPSVPSMTQLIIGKDDERIADNSASVIGLIYGEAGPNWLKQQIAAQTDPTAKARLQRVETTIKSYAAEARHERLAAERALEQRKKADAAETFE